MNTLFIKSIGALFLGVSLAAAVDTPELVHPSPKPATDKPAPFTDQHWKKITLSEEFMSEGANFGDFNHDGIQDVVSGPYWYEGPEYTKKHEYMPVAKFDPHGYSKNFFAYTHSMKNDGWDDIIIIGFPGEDTSWYENPRGKETKDGHWARHVGFEHTDNESAVFADVFGNKKPVLLCSTGGKMGYAAPDYSDVEKPWTFHPISPNKGYQRFTHGLGFGDINGDGKADVLVHDGWYEQPASLDGDPEWKFHGADFGSGGAQMYAYDVNGDGRADVISSLEAHGFGLAWFEQNKDGTFTKHLITGSKASDNPQGVEFSQIHAIDLIDINGDGLKDIVTGKRFWAHTTDVEANAPAVLYWFELKRENGNAEFIPHLIDNNSGVGTEVTAKDINGDKRPAIVVGNKKGTFVFLQQPEKAAAAAK